jgi:hypothetical protein
MAAQGRADPAQQIMRGWANYFRHAVCKHTLDYLGGVLGETAISAGRTQTREGARYRRLARTHVQRLESLGFKVAFTPLPNLTGCPEVA